MAPELTRRELLATLGGAIAANAVLRAQQQSPQNPPGPPTVVSTPPRDFGPDATTTYFNDPDVLAKVTRGLGEPMRGLDVRTMPAEERLADRGW